MKTEQKQIEEMAKQMCGAIDNSCIHDCTPACGAREYAKRCFKAGYRKASDVIDEFVERLKELLIKHEHRSQTDSVPFYQINAESFCDELDELAEEMRKEV